jgi:DnaJ-class molecular chaperone
VQQHTINCAFCLGTGKHPHFMKEICPVCKGVGSHRVKGKYMPCGECHQTGQKSGTVLTCYMCGGLGEIPDTRDIMKQARQEIRKGRRMLEEEKHPTR